MNSHLVGSRRVGQCVWAAVGLSLIKRFPQAGKENSVTAFYIKVVNCSKQLPAPSGIQNRAQGDFYGLPDFPGAHMTYAPPFCLFSFHVRNFPLRESLGSPGPWKIPERRVMGDASGSEAITGLGKSRPQETKYFFFKEIWSI